MLLVWWQLKSMTSLEKKEFYAAIISANYWVVIPVVMMSLASHISRSYRWKLMMEPLGFNPKIQNIFMVTMVGYLANAAIPRLGELLKCTFLSKYEKIKVDKLVGTIIIERSFDLICFVIFICITFLIQLNLIGSFLGKKLSTFQQTENNLFPFKYIMIFAIIIFTFFIAKWVFKKYRDNKIIAKLKSFINGVWEGFISIKNLKKRKQFIAHTLFIWAMYLGQIYVGFWTMDATSVLGINAACSVLMLASLSMIVTPGGIGSFPIFVMQTLVIYQINPALGKAFGWMMWGVSTSLIIISGCIALIILPYFNKQTNESNQ